ncbi:MAG: hypothetical protein J7599_07645 [Niabella sp.]|nr:hypothetical protein [Niabella sp.]
MNNTFTIEVGSLGELLINADYEIFDPSAEECHGIKSFPASVTVDIKSVELIIDKEGLLITGALKKHQIEAIEEEIINQLAIAA